MRSFMFRLGHIFSLYFGRDVRHGFILLDEPENSLFPDFLYDLIDIYSGIVRNTQIFVATHNPIIAAQFRPEERVILEFDDSYHVTARAESLPSATTPTTSSLKTSTFAAFMGGKESRSGSAFWNCVASLSKLRTPRGNAN